jgi:hypothetical protein
MLSHFISVKIGNSQQLVEDSRHNKSSISVDAIYASTSFDADPCISGYHKATHNGINFDVKTKTCVN